MINRRTEPTKTYYGWFIVAAVFAVLMVTVGARNSVGVFVLGSAKRKSMDEKQLATTVRILGIDPGSRITGYGVIDLIGVKPRYVASGCIRTADGALEQRLAQIYAGISELIGLHRPDAVAVERVFMAKNADSVKKLIVQSLFLMQLNTQKTRMFFQNTRFGILKIKS